MIQYTKLCRITSAGARQRFIRAAAQCCRSGRGLCHFAASPQQELQMQTDAISARTGADGFLERLADLGIDTLFANAGTDFPPIVEALAKASALGRNPIKAIAVPHENLAVSMAYGRYRVSGQPQALMRHV